MIIYIKNFIRKLFIFTYIIEDFFRYKQRLVILCFHKTTKFLPSSKFDSYNLDFDKFKNLIVVLKKNKNINFIDPKSLINLTVENKPKILKKNKINLILSFDDCWEHTVDASKFLSHHGIFGIFFVPMNHIGRDHYSFSSYDKDVFEKYGKCNENLKPISFESINKIINLGMLVQPHGYNHISLGNASIKKMKEDIDKSIIATKKKFDLDTSFFCYPYGSGILGDYNDNVINHLKTRGVKYAFTTDMGFNNIDNIHKNNLSLKRIPALELKSNIAINSYNSGSVFILKIFKEISQKIRKFLSI